MIIAGVFLTNDLFSVKTADSAQNEMAGTSIADAIDTLVQGKAILHSLTVPEGLTSEQILARLYENEILSGEVNETPREGTLLPDTYKFERGATRQQIVNLMKAKQREVLNQIWLRRSAEVPVRTPAVTDDGGAGPGAAASRPAYRGAGTRSSTAAICGVSVPLAAASW